GDGIKTMEMIRSAQQLKLTTVSKPDISTLLRIGHFYFALTSTEKTLDFPRPGCLYVPVGIGW
ncbi:MAG: hypothetical protein ABSC55_14760, partial [Syntrophorhabdales bacterium]